MALPREAIKEILKHPRHRTDISKAKAQEAKLRFQTESNLSPMDISAPFTEFCNWVKTLIPKDKYEIFLTLFRFPHRNVQLVSEIYEELERVFDGRNSAVNFQFSDSTLADDWEWYRQEKLKEPQVWKTKAWNVFKTAINSIIVVDMPTEQTTDRVEPYFYFLDIDSVIDFEMKGDIFSWIIFRQDDNKIAIFDEESMSIYTLDKNGEPEELLSEVSHGLGYCPARFFWTDSLTQNNPAIKKSPLSPQIANLEWLLFFSVSKKHLDLYAPYPIYSAYEADCNFRNNSTGDYCDGGFLRDANGNYRVLRDGSVERCPVCSAKRIAGVGSFIEVPLPMNGTDLRDPVTITTIDKNSLDYNTAEEARLAREIYTSVTGSPGEAQQKMSVNELQVEASFEDKKNVLLSLKRNFESAMTFVSETICKLRYGDAYLSCNINMGTEFYLYSVAELQSMYTQAKAAGASEARLDAISDLLIATENRNNPLQMQRMYILKQLEPYRHLTLAELQSLMAKSLIDEEMMLIKINFATFVDRFERENINIIEFASNLPLDKKIDIINSKFKDYVKEQQSNAG